MAKEILAHALSRVTKAPNGCWLSGWYADRKGYTQIWNNGRMVLVHRLVYEGMVGPIPDGLQIDHLCRTPQCCNPEHLEPVTAWENSNRRPFTGAPREVKTHCVNGHEYNEQNTRHNSKGYRFCQACRAAKRRDWKRLRYA